MDTILTRGVEAVVPGREALANYLSNKSITLYHGIDPTAPSLHLGHLATLLKVKDFQDQGHQVVVLFGGFTATIGDPTDKMAARKVLTLSEVEHNMANYKQLILKILDPQRTVFRNNREWYEKMPLIDFIGLTTKVTVQQNLKRDMFQQRQADGKEIYLNEFLYPILHGYDGVVLGVDLEVGGNDQLFNMLVGRDLMKKIKDKEKFVLTTKLLVDAAGKKMGKTEGNMANLVDAPEEMFGKIMSWTDSMMPIAFEILTRVSVEEINAILAGHPKEAKMRLAEEVVKIVHGEDKSLEAKNYFNQTFSNGVTPANISTITALPRTKLVEVLLNEDLIESKSEFRRLVEQGGISINGLKIVDIDKLVEEGVVKIGTRRFVKILLN